MAAPREPGAARPSGHPPSLLSLPASCVERVVQLVLCDEGNADIRLPLQASFGGGHDDGAAVVWGLPAGVSAEPLLACKALWQAAAPLLHCWAHVKGAKDAPAAAYEEPLRAHSSTLRWLVISGSEHRWPAGVSLASFLALAPPQLEGLRLPGNPGSQLARFTALKALSLHASEPWPAWPPSLRQLSIYCRKDLTDSLLNSLAPLSQLRTLELWCENVQADPRSTALSRLALRTLSIALSGGVNPPLEAQLPPFNPALEQLFVSGPEIWGVDVLPDLQLIGSGSWLGQLRHMTLLRVLLDDPPEALYCPNLESLHLTQCSDHWFTPPVLSTLTGLTRLVVECNGVEGLDLRPLRQLRELSIVAEGLTDLPPGVPQLPGLTALDVSWNRLEALPAGPYLSTLRRLSLAHNSFQSAPASLAAATALTALDLTGCSSLGPSMQPLAVLAQVSHLRMVHFEHGVLPWYSVDMQTLLSRLQRIKEDFQLAARLQGALRRRPADRPAALDTTSGLVLAQPLFPVQEFWAHHVGDMPAA